MEAKGGDQRFEINKDSLKYAMQEIKKAYDRTRKKRVKVLQYIVHQLNSVIPQPHETEKNGETEKIVEFLTPLTEVIMEVCKLLLDLINQNIKAAEKLSYETSILTNILESLFIQVRSWCYEHYAEEEEDDENSDHKASVEFVERTFTPLINILECLVRCSSWRCAEIFKTAISLILSSWEGVAKRVPDMLKNWSQSVTRTMEQFGKNIATCGDFSCQYFQIIVIQQWLSWVGHQSGRKFINSIFPSVEHDVRKLLIDNSHVDFDYVARVFLNSLNSIAVGTSLSSLVTSVRCVNLYANGNFEIKGPQDDLVKEFWVDFSTTSRRIHAFFFLPDNPWISLDIGSEQIDSICVTWLRRNDSQLMTQTQFEQSQISKNSNLEYESMIFLHVILKHTLDELSPELGELKSKNITSLMFVFKDVAVVEKILQQMSWATHPNGEICQKSMPLAYLDPVSPKTPRQMVEDISFLQQTSGISFDRGGDEEMVETLSEPEIIREGKPRSRRMGTPFANFAGVAEKNLLFNYDDENDENVVPTSITKYQRKTKVIPNGEKSQKSMPLINLDPISPKTPQQMVEDTSFLQQKSGISFDFGEDEEMVENLSEPEIIREGKPHSRRIGTPFANFAGVAEENLLFNYDDENDENAVPTSTTKYQRKKKVIPNGEKSQKSMPLINLDPVSLKTPQQMVEDISFLQQTSGISFDRGEDEEMVETLSEPEIIREGKPHSRRIGTPFANFAGVAEKNLLFNYDDENDENAVPTSTTKYQKKNKVMPNEDKNEKSMPLINLDPVSPKTPRQMVEDISFLQQTSGISFDFGEDEEMVEKLPEPQVIREGKPHSRRIGTPFANFAGVAEKNLLFNYDEENDENAVPTSTTKYQKKNKVMPIKKPVMIQNQLPLKVGHVTFNKNKEDVPIAEDKRVPCYMRKVSPVDRSSLIDFSPKFLDPYDITQTKEYIWEKKMKTYPKKRIIRKKRVYDDEGVEKELEEIEKLLENHKKRQELIPKKRGRPTKPKSQNPKPKSQHPKPKSQNPKSKNPKPKSQNPKPKSQNPKPKSHAEPATNPMTTNNLLSDTFDWDNIDLDL